MKWVKYTLFHKFKTINYRRRIVAEKSIADETRQTNSRRNFADKPKVTYIL